MSLAKRAVHWDEWRRHWTLVLACAFGFSFSSVINYSFGLFIEPLVHDFGWSRAQTSAGLTISGLVSVLLSPVVGLMIDRFGVRRFAIPGLFLLAMSVCSFALSDGSAKQWFALWCAFALIDLAVKSTVWTTAVAYAFTAERSLAIAFTLGGVSLALIVGPPLAEHLIAAYGWRTAFVAIGAGWGGVALLLCILFLTDTRRDPRASAVSEAPPSPQDRAAQRLATRGLSVPQALRNGPLVRIAVATFITMLLGLAVQVHQVPILTAGGISREHAAYLASLGGIAGILGKLVTGWLMDRADAGHVGAITLAVSAVAYGLLLDSVRSVPLTVIAMMVIGYAAAAKLQICAYMTTKYAGMRNFGTIFGFMSSLIALGGGLGPFVAGAVFDAYGSYNPLIAASVAGTLVSAALIFGLGNYPDWSVAPSAEAVPLPS